MANFANGGRTEKSLHMDEKRRLRREAEAKGDTDHGSRRGKSAGGSTSNPARGISGRQPIN